MVCSAVSAHRTRRGGASTPRPAKPYSSSSAPCVIRPSRMTMAERRDLRCKESLAARRPATPPSVTRRHCVTRRSPGTSTRSTASCPRHRKWCPGTAMAVSITDPQQRANLVAYLKWIKAHPPARGGKSGSARSGGHGTSESDWKKDAPGRAHKIDLNALPAPFATPSARNNPEAGTAPGLCATVGSERLQGRIVCQGSGRSAQDRGHTGRRSVCD